MLTSNRLKREQLYFADEIYTQTSTSPINNQTTAVVRQRLRLRYSTFDDLQCLRDFKLMIFAFLVTQEPCGPLLISYVLFRPKLKHD